jgi:RNA polymerase-binding transcription factor DksA
MLRPMKETFTLPAAAASAKWNWHWHTLLRLREALVQDHETRRSALRTVSDDGATDVVDVAGEQQERDELLAALSCEEVELSEIDAALQRLSNGTYGICQATGEPIPAIRLRAIPWTRFTREAAARRETFFPSYHD